MGKPSSSKKKRSKISSLSQTRKRKTVKSRRSKSKKLQRRRDGSDSYSGDSDSRSSVSVSSYSSEDDYRSGRSRSRNRKDVKGGKKRARRRSSGSESSENSPRIKKHRRSRRSGDYEKRKRSRKKKRSRRDVSVSFRSSTCRSGSSSGSDEIGYERTSVRSQREEKYGRRSKKAKTGSKRSRDRSRSSSSCSRYNEGTDHPTEEGVMEESNSRRLKSVITVVRQETDSSRELNTNEPKEEVYDYDDYPSCRSNDCNDGCSWRELPQQSYLVSEMKRPLDDEQQGEVSNIRTISVEENGKDGKPRYDGVGDNDALRENNQISSPPCGLNGEDMELILRQRALENLRKFRGGIQTSLNPPITQNDKSDGNVKAPSSVNTDPFQIKTPKGDDIRVVIASQVRQQTRQPPVRNSSTLPKNDRKTSHLHDDSKDSGTVGSCVASATAQVFPAGAPRVEVNTAINSVSNESKLVTSQTRQETPEPRTCTIEKKEPATQEPSQAKLLTKSQVSEVGLETAQTENSSAKDSAAVNSVTNGPKSVKLQIRQESPNTYTTKKLESAVLEPSQAKLVTYTSVIENGLGTAQTVKPPECGDNGGEVSNNHGSACDKSASSSISGDISSNKREDETKGGSQFQQKTMSVMRGGEMVQVSYQVYIPKRAPALARRQLKR